MVRITTTQCDHTQTHAPTHTHRGGVRRERKPQAALARAYYLSPNYHLLGGNVTSWCLASQHRSRKAKTVKRSKLRCVILPPQTKTRARWRFRSRARFPQPSRTRRNGERAHRRVRMRTYARARTGKRTHAHEHAQARARARSRARALARLQVGHVFQT